MLGDDHGLGNEVKYLLGLYNDFVIGEIEFIYYFDLLRRNTGLQNKNKLLVCNILSIFYIFYILYVY